MSFILTFKDFLAKKDRVKVSVAETPLFWAAPAPDGQCPGADSGSDLLKPAPACLKNAAGAALKNAAPAPTNKQIGSGAALKVTAPAPQHCLKSFYLIKRDTGEVEDCGKYCLQHKIMINAI